MKRKIPILILLTILIASVCGRAFAINGGGQGFADVFNGWMSTEHTDTVSEINTDMEIGKEETAVFTADIPKGGDYNVILEYKTLEPVILKSTLKIKVGETEAFTQIFSVWRDETKDYKTDRFSNQVVPAQKILDVFIEDFVKDQASVGKRAVVFPLGAGENTVEITANDIAVHLKSVKICTPDEPVTYEEYSKRGGAAGTDFIIIEGEDYTAKSDSYMRSKAVQNAALYPYEVNTRMLNALDGGSFRTAGQKIFYAFNVDNKGLYRMALRYSQDAKQGLPSFMSIELDGKPVFAELASYPFPYTGSGYENLTLSDGAEFEIHLEKGTHTLSFEADGTPHAEEIKKLKEIMTGISSVGLDIKSVAGMSSDANRTWDIESYIPGVTDRLNGYKNELSEIYSRMGEAPATLNMKLAVSSLEKLFKTPNKLPSSLGELSEGSGSVTQLLADQIDTLNNQSLSIERIYFYGNHELPKAKAGFFTALGNSVSRFFYSMFFARDTVNTVDGGMLNVWINRPIQYMETLGEMIDTEFTPKTGIKVNLSIMSGEQKLLLANATNTSPDVALGLGAGTPYDFAIRGAAAELTQFDDFYTALEEDYQEEAFLPFTYKGKVYGAVETQEFYVLMYRKDIMEKLGLGIPDTWDDVAAMMPELRRNSMSFYLQLSGWPGTKPLYTTAPFILQAGGRLVSDDGLSTAVNSPEALKGFETLTNLYRLYSLPENVSSFYQSFRYGQIPIGIGSFTDYVKIKNAAPEIADMWAVSQPPGMKRDDSTVTRGTTAAASACVILESSQRKSDSWEFLKWWLSSDVQTAFGNSLQTKYGPEYLWNSANLTAFDKLSFPEHDRKIIIGQWKNMLEIERHPALYMVERELSTAWIDVVLNGKSPRIALDKAALKINREFTRRLEEFE